MKIESEHRTMITFGDLINMLRTMGYPIPRNATFSFPETATRDRILIRWMTEKEVDAVVPAPEVRS